MKYLFLISFFIYTHSVASPCAKNLGKAWTQGASLKGNFVASGTTSIARLWSKSEEGASRADQSYPGAVSIETANTCNVVRKGKTNSTGSIVPFGELSMTKLEFKSGVDFILVKSSTFLNSINTESHLFKYFGGDKLEVVWTGVSFSQSPSGKIYSDVVLSAVKDSKLPKIKYTDRASNTSETFIWSNSKESFVKAN